MMKSVKNDILQNQLEQNNTSMNYDRLYGEMFHELFPRSMNATNLLYPFFKTVYQKLLQMELVPCIAVDMNKKKTTKSYFMFKAMEECLFVDEHITEQKLDDQLNLLMKLKCPIPFFKYFLEKRKKEGFNSSYGHDLPQENDKIKFSMEMLTVAETLKLKLKKMDHLNLLGFLQTLKDDDIFPVDGKSELPAKIEHSVVSQTEVFKILNYLLKYLAKDQKTKYNISNIPLLLTTDHVLRRFGSVKELYSFRWRHILPQQKTCLLEMVMMKST